ncbi:MAG: hypothetical protein HJJLKODD_02159 [Phycisphaerae bacterium]|nr:hypothetical protein [Phycisphaerae bacterium]
MSDGAQSQDLMRETWRVFRIMAEFVEGFEVMSRIGPAVSIFGSARTEPGTHYYQQAREMARKFASRGLAVITGGGPGIMEAANRGAYEARGRSVGLNIYLPNEQVPNPYQNVELHFRYFFCRKVMFVKYASAFVCFPGGFGTMDEYFESMTLIQTQRTEKMPVVLIGRDFWMPLQQVMRDVMCSKYHYIDEKDLDLFLITDDLDQGVEHVMQQVDEQIQRFRMLHADSQAGTTPGKPSSRDPMLEY